MFSQACVKNSVQRDGGGGSCAGQGHAWWGEHAWREGHVWQRGHAWGCAWQGCVDDRGCVWQGACMVGEKHAWQEGHVWQGGHAGGACMAGGVHGRRDQHCSGWYTSYLNAFLGTFVGFLYRICWDPRIADFLSNPKN